jgi:hypothetical protein
VEVNMKRLLTYAGAATFLAASLLSWATQPHTASAAENVSPPANGATATKPAVPAFKPGMPVVDRTGADIGIVQTIAETAQGLNIVVKVDGKLIGAPVATMTLRDDHAVSAQTKEELLANAHAPR